jgi:aspartyl-tRNA(Asn)/glutamyl-tRNA(Gln) amidotransferase subunit B
MRSKEDSEDYRYFPEPDLPPLRPDPAWLAEISAGLPELPAARRMRYADGLGLSAHDVGALTASRETSDYFDAAVALASAGDPAVPPKVVANWITGELARVLNAAPGADRGRIDRGGIGAADLVELLRLVESGAISGTSAKEALAEASATGRTPADVVAERGMQRISDADAIGSVVAEVVAANPAAAADYRAGKEQAVGFLVGQVMKRTGGRADATLVRSALRAHLDGDAAEAGRGS